MKTRILLILSASLISTKVNCQSAVDSAETFTIRKMHSDTIYLKDTYDVFYQSLFDKGVVPDIMRRVMVGFEVESNNTVKNVFLVQSSDTFLDRLAMESIRSLPVHLITQLRSMFQPGVVYVIPIRFKFE